MQKKAKILGLIVICAAVVVVAAYLYLNQLKLDDQHFYDAVVLLKNGQYDQSVRQFRIVLEGGDERAAETLAFIYAEGLGVKKNALVAAAYSLNRTQDFDELFHEVGRLYHAGTLSGVVQDPEGLRWYSASAELGNLESLELMEAVYRKGMFGVEIDNAVADYWAERASESVN